MQTNKLLVNVRHKSLTVIRNSVSREIPKYLSKATLQNLGGRFMAILMDVIEGI